MVRALRLHGSRDLRLDDVPEPALRAGAVRVDVAWAGICGSDLFLYETSPVPVDFVHPVTGERGPHTLGHEFAGTVSEIACDVEGVRVGDLIAVEPILFDGTCPACRRGDTNLCDANGFIGIHGWGGGFSERVVVPADRAHVLPSDLSHEVAALIEPSAVAWRAVTRSGMRRGDSVLVLGGGPVGLCLALVARARGAGTVVVSEPGALRRGGALACGADAVIDPVAEDLVDGVFARVGRDGVDVVFDACGVPSASAPLPVLLRKGGTAVAVATAPPRDLDMNALMIREQTLLGSYAYSGDDFGNVVEEVRRGRLQLSGLVSTRVALDDAIESGFRALLDSPGDHLKVLVHP